MAIIAPNDHLARAEIRFDWDNQEVENTLWFENINAWTAGELNTLTELLETWRQNWLRPLQSNTVTAREIYARRWSPDPAPSDTRLILVDPTGALTSGSMPNNTTIAIKFTTGFTGRSARGRNFFIGLTEAQVSQNTVASATLTAIESAYFELLASVTDIFGSDVHWVVASLYFEGEPRGSAQGLPINAISVTNDIVDSQRRRLPGRGR